MLDRVYSRSIKNQCKLGVFKNYISLGHCCFIASDLEKLGLRSCSLPFDWNFTYWKAIETSINTHFNDYVKKSCLYQWKLHPHVYENLEVGVSFVHDFVNYLPLDK